MEGLRRACREALSQRHSTSSTFPEAQVVNITLSEELDLLWQDVSSEGSKSNLDVSKTSVDYVEYKHILMMP